MQKTNLIQSYEYDGKDQFLKELNDHSPLFLSIFIYLIIFFTGILYIQNVDLTTFYEENLTNASLYFFAAQATLIGLIFPVVIAYMSLANVGRASSDKLMTIYRSCTGLGILATSSFLLLTAYAVVFVSQYFGDSSIINQVQLSLVIWLIFNFYVSYIFLSKTLNFIDGSQKIKEIIKYSYNNKDYIEHSLVIIFDEIKYYINDKNRSYTLILQLAEFIEINTKKHDLTDNEFSVLIQKIRVFIRECLDYKDTQALRRIFYVYLNIHNGLDKKQIQKKYISLQYTQFIIYDILLRNDFEKNYKDTLVKTFFEIWNSWNAWGSYAIPNENKKSYSEFCIEIISLLLRKNIIIDDVLDNFLTITVDCYDFMGNPYDIHTEDNFEKFSSDLGVDHKIVLIKIIIDSQLKKKSQKKYVKLIVNSETPLSDVFHLKVAKKIDGAATLFSSLLRSLINFDYGHALTDLYERSVDFDTRLDRTRVVTSPNFTSAFLPVYILIFNSYLPNKQIGSSFKAHVNQLSIKDKIHLYELIENHASNLDLKDPSVVAYSQAVKVLVETVQNSIIIYFTKNNYNQHDRNKFLINQLYTISPDMSLGLYFKKLEAEKICLKNLPVDSFSIRYPIRFQIFLSELYSNGPVTIIRSNNNLGLNLAESAILDVFNKSVNTSNKTCSDPLNELLSDLYTKPKGEYFAIVSSFDFLRKGIQYTNVSASHFLINGYDVYVSEYLKTLNIYGGILNINIINSVDVLPINNVVSRGTMKLRYRPRKKLDFIVDINYCLTTNINNSESIQTYSQI